MTKTKETQENSERQFKELGNKIREQKFFTKVTETIKKQILELKNSKWDGKWLESIGSKADNMEEN